MSVHLNVLQEFSEKIKGAISSRAQVGEIS